MLVQALRPFRPYLRGAEPNLPFVFDERTLRHGYQDLLPFAHRARGYGCEFLALDLDKLIELKRFAGRAKDHEAIAELEAIRQDRIASEKKNDGAGSGPNAR